MKITLHHPARILIAKGVASGHVPKELILYNMIGRDTESFDLPLGKYFVRIRDSSGLSLDMRLNHDQQVNISELIIQRIEYRLPNYVISFGL